MSALTQVSSCPSRSRSRSYAAVAGRRRLRAPRGDRWPAGRRLRGIAFEHPARSTVALRRPRHRPHARDFGFVNDKSRRGGTCSVRRPPRRARRLAHRGDLRRRASWSGPAPSGARSCRSTPRPRRACATTRCTPASHRVVVTHPGAHPWTHRSRSPWRWSTSSSSCRLPAHDRGQPPVRKVRRCRQSPGPARSPVRTSATIGGDLAQRLAAVGDRVLLVGRRARPWCRSSAPSAHEQHVVPEAAVAAHLADDPAGHHAVHDVLGDPAAPPGRRTRPRR